MIASSHLFKNPTSLRYDSLAPAPRSARAHAYTHNKRAGQLTCPSALLSAMRAVNGVLFQSATESRTLGSKSEIPVIPNGQAGRTV